MSRTDDVERRATRSVVVAFVVATAGAVMFMVVFALDADTQLLGVALALALGGLGYGLVAWGHRLMPPGGAIESRQLMRDPEEHRRDAVEEFDDGVSGIGRRRLLGGAFAAALGTTGLAALFPLRSLGPRPADELRHTEFALTPRSRLVTDDGRPVHVDDLSVGSTLTVYPEGHTGSGTAQTMLIRLPRGADLRPPTRTDWVAADHIAYSKVCTHAGCSVGLYQVEFQSLLCPCHQSSFQVTEGARPTLGPADRALPQLPLGIDDDGYLVALGDYREAVGPGWWTRP